MTEQLAESGLIWNCHQLLVKCSVRVGREHGSMRSQPIHNQTLGTVCTGCRSQSSLCSACLCVSVCALTCLCWTKPWYRICAEYLPQLSPPLSESCLCNWSQTGHLSCQQRFISFLSFRQALYCFQMGKALQGSSLFLKKKCNALMSLPYKNHAARGETYTTQRITDLCHSVKFIGHADNLLFTFVCICLCDYCVCEWKHIIVHLWQC